MRVKVNVHPMEPQPDYPLRVSSFLASVGAHCCAVAALATLWTFPGPRVARPVYEEFIKPHEQHILFYDSRQKVPDVAPMKEIGNAPDPRGAELSRQAIVATSRKPESTQLFMSVPAPEIEIHQDLPAPLLVANVDITPPPPPERPKPRKFVPPPPANQEPPLPIQIPLLDAPSIASRAALLPLEPPPVSTAVLSPPRNPAEAPTAQSGNASANVAVASLHPVENMTIPLPNAERPAQFSKAPTQGPAASGGANTAALTVPDLTIRQPKPENIPLMPAQQILYADIVRNIPFSTLSAPLRPSSRSIPQAIDARFNGRTVYAIVLPMEHMRVYTGDWIIWFADRQSSPGETPLVHGPVPVRKLEIVDQTPASRRTGARIQLAATLRKDGTLDGVTLLTETSAAVQQAVLQDISSWEFQPATRDGASVDVDMVLEIPFSLPTAIAKSP
jgi:hypothetical protein